MPNKRPVVMVFGRFNPPTIGHEALVQYVQSVAHRVGGDVRVYPSQSQDARKNPLPFKNKVRFLRSFFPSVTISDNSNVRTPIDALAEVSALGYTDVILVAGSDRVRDFEKLGAYLVPRSSPKYDATKHIPIDRYRVVGVPGDRDPDAEGVAGMSASKMRKLAAANDMASFMQGIPRHVSQIVAKDLFKQVRQYMGLHERFNIAQGQFTVGLFEAHKVMKEDHVKVGDKVHAGFGQRGGAGFSGVVDRIDGNYVYVNIGKDKFGDRIIKAPHSHVMKEAKDDYTFDATAIEHNKVVDQMWGLAKHEFPHAVTMFRKKHPHATISFMNKSGTVVKVVKSGENLKEAETPTATKPPSETERLRTTQQQELIALKTRQANAMMAAKLRDVQMKAREAQAKANQPKPAAKPAS